MTSSIWITWFDQSNSNYLDPANLIKLSLFEKVNFFNLISSIWFVYLDLINLFQITFIRSTKSYELDLFLLIQSTWFYLPDFINTIWPPTLPMKADLILTQFNLSLSNFLYSTIIWPWSLFLFIYIANTNVLKTALFLTTQTWIWWKLSDQAVIHLKIFHNICICTVYLLKRIFSFAESFCFSKNFMQGVAWLENPA